MLPQPPGSLRPLGLCRKSTWGHTNDRLHVRVPEIAHKVFVRRQRIPWPQSRLQRSHRQITITKTCIVSFPATHSGAPVSLLMMMRLPSPMPTEATTVAAAITTGASSFFEILGESIAQRWPTRWVWHLGQLALLGRTSWCCSGRPRLEATRRTAASGLLMLLLAVVVAVVVAVLVVMLAGRLATGWTASRVYRVVGSMVGRREWSTSFVVIDWRCRMWALSWSRHWVYGSRGNCLVSDNKKTSL